MNSLPAVRRAEPADIDQLAALAVRFYSEEGFGTPADALLVNLEMLVNSSAAQVLIGEADGRAAAFAVTTMNPGLEHRLVAELQDLYVLPEHRGRGVATALIDEVKTWAARRGCEVLDIVIDAHGALRHDLVAFYRKRGFHDQGRRLVSASLTAHGD